MSDRDRLAAIVRCERWHRFTQPCDEACAAPPSTWDYDVADALLSAGVIMPMTREKAERLYDRTLRAMHPDKVLLERMSELKAAESVSPHDGAEEI